MAEPQVIAIDRSFDFLQGGGKMGERMRAKDWSRTPLGSPGDWPQSLKTVIRIVLTSRYQMWMCWGPDLTFFCNDAYMPTLGVKQDWALGMRSDNVWKEIWPEIGPRIETVMDTNTATYEENLMLILERSGYAEETYHTFSYSPLSDDEGAVVGMLCVVTEETDKVIGERRVALLGRLAARLSSVRTEKDLAATVTAACLGHPDIPFELIFLTDEAGHPSLQSATEQVVQTDLGAWLESLLPIGEQDGRQLRAVELPPGFRAHVPLESLTEPPTHAAIVGIPQAGTTVSAGYLLVGLNPFRQLDESYSRFLELFAGQIGSSLANARAHDAERKRAAALAEIDRAKTVFFSNISHEFRTPLTLMLGPLADSLGDFGASLPPSQRSRVEVAHRNALRLLKLVNSLLDFSRIEAGRIQARYEPVDLSTFTSELVSNFRSATDRVGLSLVVSCPPLDEPIYVDREMWETIVLNLVSNAFKFTFEGQISVALRKTEGFAELTVSDSGVGIPQAEVPRLFERFRRVEGQRSRTHEGSGIGLALVHELVGLHRGSIAVESEVGRGTRFVIQIPSGHAHLPDEQIRAPATGHLSFRPEAFTQEALRWLADTPISDDIDYQDAGLPDTPATQFPARILLVDDNADMRAYVYRLLKDRWEVEIAEDGEAALESIRRARPDLVLSDIMMPKLDGFGLLDAIRNDPVLRDLPVILLSARAGEEAEIEGLGAGANDYLVKPFSAREMISRVSAHLELARIRQESTQALRQRTDQYETLLNAAPLGVYLVDADFRIRDINPPALAVFGDIPNLIGQDFDDVIHVLWQKNYADEIVDLFRHTLETGQPYQTLERAEERRDRQVTEYYEWQIHRISIPGGQYGVVCYFRDISAQVFARQRQKLLLDELNHRVKNTLTTVLSIAMQTLRGAKNTDDARKGLESRLIALSKAHDVLTREEWVKASLHDIVSASIVPYTGGEQHSRFDIDGPAIDVQPKTALALSLALHELSTNAVKYGALSRDNGRVGIKWRVDGAKFSFEWMESRGPTVTPPQTRGFGSRLIERGLAYDLAGEVRLDFAPTGVVCSITAQLDELTA